MDDCLHVSPSNHEDWGILFKRRKPYICVDIFNHGDLADADMVQDLLYGDLLRDENGRIYISMNTVRRVFRKAGFTDTLKLLDHYVMLSKRRIAH